MPKPHGDSRQRRVQAHGVVAGVAAIAEQHAGLVMSTTAHFATLVIFVHVVAYTRRQQSLSIRQTKLLGGHLPLLPLPTFAANLLQWPKTSHLTFAKGTLRAALRPSSNAAMAELVATALHFQTRRWREVTDADDAVD